VSPVPMTRERAGMGVRSLPFPDFDEFMVLLQRTPFGFIGPARVSEEVVSTELYGKGTSSPTSSSCVDTCGSQVVSREAL